MTPFFLRSASLVRILITSTTIQHRLAIAAAVAVVQGCATTPLPPVEARHHVAARELSEARARRKSPEERLAHYLKAAEEAAPHQGQGAESLAVREIYNNAVEEATL